ASTPSTRIAMPSGPEATLSGPVTGGKGVSLTSAGSTDLARAGYTESEYFASGTAASYRYAGAHGKDGRWAVAPKDSATYRTRIVVRRPRDPQKFNGTLLVEWLNVTAGSDTSADFSTAGTEITRSGYAWVGVSAQQIGVQGGAAVIPIAGLPNGGLRAADPARYGSLHHPGDQYAFDIFSQIGRSLRSPGRTDALGGLRPQRMVAIGESQSAFQLTTYIDAIQPTARIFDGFFVHSRGGGAIPLTGGGITTGIVGGIRIRDDIDVPVFLFETETDLDLLHYVDASQPDSNHLRVWEVAGAAHADAYLLGGNANALGCHGEINTAPTHYVVEAALHRLDEWLRTGSPPASAPRLQVALAKGSLRVQRDAQGNAIGGVRTAANDVPVAALSGDSADSSILCVLFGSTRPFDHATIRRLYPTKAAYLAAFGRATDKAIASGYLLPADRAAILADAAKANV
ncbi:MAG TPA: alpha/beta hydrolase domain-containing protein, partial [Acidimicrobiia bacterium]